MVTNKRQRTYLLLVALFGLFNLSFRTGYVTPNTTPHWAVTRADPVVWLKFCDDDVFYVDEEVDGDGSVIIVNDFASIKQTVLAQFNLVTSSYLRVALHPDDPDAGLVTTSYDSTFDAESASVRTISICSNPSDPTLAGYAVPTLNTATSVCEAPAPGSYLETYCRKAWLASCPVVMVKNNLPTARHFTHTLIHELMHCMGVLHNHETHQSLMSYVADPQAVYRLTSDDKMALTYLYPSTPELGREQPTLGLACSPSPATGN